MMKNFVCEIYESEHKTFNLYCKDIRDYVSLILLIARKLKTYVPINPADINFPYLRVYVDKFSRAFIYVEQNKYFSVTFPLNIKIDKKNNNLTLYTKNALCELSNKAISDCIGVVNTMKESGALLEAWMESSIDSKDNYDEEYDRVILNILECLFSSEPGYVRYDYDPEHKKMNHPEIHLDVNMSRDATFKLGLYEKLSPTKFKDIVDNNSNCFYLSDFEEKNTVKKRLQKPTSKRKNSRKRKRKK